MTLSLPSSPPSSELLSITRKAGTGHGRTGGDGCGTPVEEKGIVDPRGSGLDPAAQSCAYLLRSRSQ